MTEHNIMFFSFDIMEGFKIQFSVTVGISILDDH